MPVGWAGLPFEPPSGVDVGRKGASAPVVGAGVDAVTTWVVEMVTVPGLGVKVVTMVTTTVAGMPFTMVVDVVVMVVDSEGEGGEMICTPSISQ